MTTNSTFFGTAEETHYLDAKGRWWLVQSPDMSSTMLAVSSAGPSHEATELRWDSCRDLHDLARGLDAQKRGGAVEGDVLAESGPETEIVSLSTIADRYGADAKAWARGAARGEANQLWEHETTLTTLRG
jgi:hypothetical protein